MLRLGESSDLYAAIRSNSKDKESEFKGKMNDLMNSLDVRRGGCAANIAFGMGVLGLNPILIAAVGKDWADYDV